MTSGTPPLDRPLSILHVIASVAPRYGGPSIAVLGMAQALGTMGHHVEIITTSVDGPLELDVPIGARIDEDGYSITYWRSQFPRLYGFSAPLARDILRRAARVDVVHAHGLYRFPSLIAGVGARRAGTPYIVRPHGTLDPYHRSRSRTRKSFYWPFVERHNLDHAAALHFTSEQERDFASSLKLHARSVVVPLGVSPPTIDRSAAVRMFRATWPRAVDKLVITFLGRLTAKKRVPLLLEAFARISSGGVHLMVAGPDDDGLLAQYQAQARALGIADRTSFLGSVGGQLKEALLTCSSVFVLPSVDENMGVAVLEAMAYAIPVVVTAGVALGAEIAAAGAGLVADSNSESLAEAIEGVVHGPKLGPTMGTAGAELVRSRYSWDVVGAQLEGMYRDAIERSGGGSSGGRG